MKMITSGGIARKSDDPFITKSNTRFQFLNANKNLDASEKVVESWVRVLSSKAEGSHGRSWIYHRQFDSDENTDKIKRSFLSWSLMLVKNML